MQTPPEFRPKTYVPVRNKIITTVGIILLSGVVGFDSSLLLSLCAIAQCEYYCTPCVSTRKGNIWNVTRGQSLCHNPPGFWSGITDCPKCHSWVE